MRQTLKLVLIIYPFWVYISLINLPDQSSYTWSERFRRPALVLISLVALLAAFVIGSSGSQSAAGANPASVSGTVQGADSPNVNLAYVYLELRDTADNMVEFTQTEEDGTYIFSNLAPGNYYVVAFDFDGNHVQTQGATFSLSDGEARTDEDLLMPLGFTVQGTVMAVGGGPISDLFILTNDGDGPGGATDESDHYSFHGVPPGDFSIHFWPSPESNAIEQTLLGTGSAGSVVTVDVDLVVGGEITGRITTANAPTEGLQDVLVDAFLLDDGGAIIPGTRFTYYGVTDANGDYGIHKLPAGDYRIQAFPADSAWAWQWWAGESTFLTAGIVTLTTGEHSSGKDMILDAASTISGTVTDSTGQPYEGTAYLYSAEGPADGFANFQTTASIVSDEGSNYQFESIPVGTYIVGFTAPTDIDSFDWGALPPADPFVSQWFDGEYSFGSATPVVVSSAGQAVTGIDALMQNPRFADVPPANSFYDYVEWMAATGISTGTVQPSGKPLYKPADAVSRQAMSVFLYRLVGETFVPPVESTFADVPTDYPFYTQIEWMAAEGISTGYAQPSGKPLYKPSAAVSRQAMAAFLFRMSGDSFVAPAEETFADVPTTNTFFQQIEWMAAMHISTGSVQPSGKPLFRPADAVSRQAMAAFLYRYDALP